MIKIHQNESSIFLNLVSEIKVLKILDLKMIIVEKKWFLQFEFRPKLKFEKKDFDIKIHQNFYLTNFINLEK